MPLPVILKVRFLDATEQHCLTQGSADSNGLSKTNVLINVFAVLDLPYRSSKLAGLERCAR